MVLLVYTTKSVTIAGKIIVFHHVCCFICEITQSIHNNIYFIVEMRKWETYKIWFYLIFHIRKEKNLWSHEECVVSIPSLFCLYSVIFKHASLSLVRLAVKQIHFFLSYHCNHSHTHIIIHLFSLRHHGLCWHMRRVCKTTTSNVKNGRERFMSKIQWR